MRKCLLVLITSAMLSSGCATMHKTRVIPDPRVPHRVAEEVDVMIWVEKPDGTLKVEKQHVPAGWWLASPQIVEP